MTPREKCVRILLRILAHPYTFTRKELADHFDMSKDAVTECIEVFRTVGLKFEQDKPHYRCAILPERGFDELERLKSLTKSDRDKIALALKQYAGNKDALYILNKIESLYDFQQLGIRALRRPELEKIDKLETAKKNEQRVILENYRSNSNETKDRLVECFHIDTEAGMIQVYDVDRKGSRHFKLNRIERVQALEAPWEYNDKHHCQYTDVFRIADNNRVNVHLLLDVYAYNALIDTFPQATRTTLPGSEPNTFDFQDQVNHKFLGLTNFIMSNAEHVQILNPPELKEQIREKAKGILDKI